MDASRIYCLSFCILFLKRYIATALPPIWAEDANPGGPITSPMAKTRGFDVRKALSTCFDGDERYHRCGCDNCHGPVKKITRERESLVETSFRIVFASVQVLLGMMNGNHIRLD